MTEKEINALNKAQKRITELNNEKAELNKSISSLKKEIEGIERFLQTNPDGKSFEMQDNIPQLKHKRRECSYQQEYDTGVFKFDLFPNFTHISEYKSISKSIDISALNIYVDKYFENLIDFYKTNIELHNYRIKEIDAELSESVFAMLSKFMD